VDLRAKYDEAIQTAKRLGFQGAATQDGEKLTFHGTVRSEAEKDEIWNVIRSLPDWEREITADIRVAPGPA